MESVGLGKVLPGAVNDGGCTFSQGYYENRAFIVSLTSKKCTLSTRRVYNVSGICFWAQCHNSYRAVGVGPDIVKC